MTNTPSPGNTTERDAFRAASRGASARRVRYALLTLALIAVTTVFCAAAQFLAETRRVRLDVTATREHSLSPRTLAMLASLDTPHELIVVAGGDRLDQASARRLVDLLDTLGRASPNLSAAWLDPSSPVGRASFETLPTRLLALREAEVAQGREDIRRAADAARDIAGRLQAMGSRLGAWSAALPGESPELLGALDELAAVPRVHERELTQVADSFPVAGVVRVAGVELPDIPAAQGSLGVVLKRAADALETIARAASQLAPREQFGAIAPDARAVQREAELARDEALRAHDAIMRAPRVKLLDTLKLLQSQDVAVILSKDEVVAIRIESVLAERPDAPGGAGRIRFAAEDAISSALAAAGGASAPVLVLVHSQQVRILEPLGPTQTDAAGAMRQLLDRVSARGMLVREWATGVDQSRPSLADARAAGRPVVWIVLPGRSDVAEAAGRMGMLARAVESLVSEGENILLSATPSLLPRVGEPDPLVAPFAPLGLRVESGRPLVETMSTPSGPRSGSAFRLLRAERDHPIGAALDGLATVLLWPSSMLIEPVDGGETVFTPLLLVDRSDRIWGESQWPTLARGGAATAEFDPRVDLGGGPWIVAAAGERFLESTTAPQRVVVVGSNGWFLDALAQQTQEVDGRVVETNPGNLELFDASVLWLAGQDDLIAPGSSRDAGPRVRPIPPGSLRLLWWLCILGPATMTLLLGALLRILRG